MFLVPVNYLAVLLCGIAAMVIGFIWYGPLFGKGKVAKAKAKMTKAYAIMFLASLLMAYVLAHFVWYAAPGSLTLLISVKTAVWAWLGFILTFGVSQFLFSAKPIKLLAIDTGYYLVTLVTMGVIFAVLR